MLKSRGKWFEKRNLIEFSEYWDYCFVFAFASELLTLSCVNLGEKVNLMIRIVRNAIGLGKPDLSLHRMTFFFSANVNFYRWNWIGFLFY
jgi:hypothetical protein